MQKLSKILLQSIPILFMIAIIPLVQNDYLLTLLYILIIFISLKIKIQKNETTVLVTGFFLMIISEYFFVSTDVETFTRNTLFGFMPLWLPFLWAYGFVVIKRSVEILNIHE